jgi:hypothetical protein
MTETSTYELAEGYRETMSRANEGQPRRMNMQFKHGSPEVETFAGSDFTAAISLIEEPKTRPVGVIAIRHPLFPSLFYYGNSADVRIWADSLNLLGQRT